MTHRLHDISAGAAEGVVPNDAENTYDVSIGRGFLLHDLLNLEAGVSTGDRAKFVSPEDDASTILPAGVRIRAGAVIEAGIQVGWNVRVEPNTTVAGNPTKVLESAILSFRVGFEFLGLETASVGVRAENYHAISFYRRLGMSEVRSEEKNITYEYYKDKYLFDEKAHVAAVSCSSGLIAS